MMQFVLAVALMGASQPQPVPESQKPKGHPTIMYTYQVKRVSCFTGFTVWRQNGPSSNPDGVIYKTVLDWRDLPVEELRALERFEYLAQFKGGGKKVEVP